MEAESILTEIWKDIRGFEGHYQASNLGRVKRLSKLSVPERVLSLGKTTKGYYEKKLTVNGKSVYRHVHRLVALAFIPNHDNKPQVNHINGIKTDNRVFNLEWVTQQENATHAHNTGLAKHREVINLTTNKRFHSIKLAAKSIKGSYKGLHHALNRDNNKYMGFEWTYAE